MYGTEVSPTLISSVTDAIIDEVKIWQSRPLDGLYPIAYVDCIHVKVRDSGVVRVKAVYLALGINLVGAKELLDRPERRRQVLVTGRHRVEDTRGAGRPHEICLFPFLPFGALNR